MRRVTTVARRAGGTSSGVADELKNPLERVPVALRLTIIVLTELDGPHHVRMGLTSRNGSADRGREKLGRTDGNGYIGTQRRPMSHRADRSGGLQLPIRRFQKRKGSPLLGYRRWAADAGPPPLRRRRRTAAVGPVLLGCRRWVAAAGLPPLGRRRRAAAAGPPPLGCRRWAAAALPPPLGIVAWDAAIAEAATTFIQASCGACPA
jgi:hypothetical protein